VLILPDVDIEAVARAAVAAKFRNAGQVCVAPQRFLVHRDHHARFEEIAVEEVRSLRVGPLISARHRERVEGMLGAATAAGASIRAGGKRPVDRPRGFFLEPTVVGGVAPEMALFSDEVFGPVLAAADFASLDEAIERANRSRHGLAAYVFTNDLAAAVRCYERLEFGMIGVNEWAPHATEAPFSGRKDSGLGHEGGREGLLDNLETKLVSLGGLG
jgi:acyl-CoA reductase-like NAD-dependent aldehyde dehydrogenase